MQHGRKSQKHSGCVESMWKTPPTHPFRCHHFIFTFSEGAAGPIQTNRTSWPSLATLWRLKINLIDQPRPQSHGFCVARSSSCSCCRRARSVTVSWLDTISLYKNAASSSSWSCRDVFSATAHVMRIVMRDDLLPRPRERERREKEGARESAC